MIKDLIFNKNKFKPQTGALVIAGAGGRGSGSGAQKPPPRPPGQTIPVSGFTVPNQGSKGREPLKGVLDKMELEKGYQFLPTKPPVLQEVAVTAEGSKILFGRSPLEYYRLLAMVTAFLGSIYDKIDADGQESLTNRNEVQEIVNVLKACNALWNNGSQANSILTKVCTNRLNYIRANNLDGLGSKGKSVEEGDIVNYQGRTYEIKGGILCPVKSSTD